MPQWWLLHCLAIRGCWNCLLLLMLKHTASEIQCIKHILEHRSMFISKPPLHPSEWHSWNCVCLLPHLQYLFVCQGTGENLYTSEALTVPIHITHCISKLLFILLGTGLHKYWHPSPFFSSVPITASSSSEDFLLVLISWSVQTWAALMFLFSVRVCLLWGMSRSG